jgi:glucose/arabinose dehydrogenase
MRLRWLIWLSLAVLGAAGCRAAVPPLPECDPENGGLTLAEGFCAAIFADGIGVARHLVVAENGDVWVNLEDAGRTSAGTTKVSGEAGRGGLVVLRDTSGDGRADRSVRIATAGGTGIALRGPWVYYSTMTTVERRRIADGRLGLTGAADTVVFGMPVEGHISRSLAFGDGDTLFVNVGSDSNSCRRNAVDKVGADPCPELGIRAGIWQYRADGVPQRHEPEARYATGIRNAVALAWLPGRGLSAVSHGRDGLHALWPAIYSSRASAEKPSEEFMRVAAGDDFGWPHCFHDLELDRKVMAPEYGGDGRTIGRCAGAKASLLGFPAHWAPDGLVLYRATRFPARYREGAFVAFHGSWNRGPEPEDGYRVVFVPLADGQPSGGWEDFADGFAGRRKSPEGARYRPVGLAVAPDGALFVSDDQRGRIWRIVPSAASQ